MYAIEVSKAVKKYKNGVQALDQLSLSVKEGQIFSLLGSRQINTHSHTDNISAPHGWRDHHARKGCLYRSGGNPF